MTIERLGELEHRSRTHVLSYDEETELLRETRALLEDQRRDFGRQSQFFRFAVGLVTTAWTLAHLWLFGLLWLILQLLPRFGFWLTFAMVSALQILVCAWFKKRAHSALLREKTRLYFPEQ